MTVRCIWIREEPGVWDTLLRIVQFGLRALDFDLWDRALNGGRGLQSLPAMVLAAGVFCLTALVVWMVLANLVRLGLFVAKAILLRRAIGPGWWLFLREPMGGGLLTLLLLRRHLWRMPTGRERNAWDEEE